MTWNAFHRRGETLRDVITLTDQRLDGTLPWDAPGVAENFTDDLDLLGALLLKWHARLSGNLERAFAHEPVDLPHAVVKAWRTTAEQMPGVRLVVDRAATSGVPEIERAMARASQLEQGRLALAAGLASGPGPDAVAIGRTLQERARDGVVPPRPAPAPEVHEEANASLVDRIKAVLAAA